MLASIYLPYRFSFKNFPEYRFTSTRKVLIHLLNNLVITLSYCTQWKRSEASFCVFADFFPCKHMYTPLNKTWFIFTFISQLTSEANPPCSTILGDSYASSTNQPHPHSPSSNADAATNSTPYTPPSLSSSYVPLLPSPSYPNSFLSIFQSKFYSFNPSPFPFSP